MVVVVLKGACFSPKSKCKVGVRSHVKRMKCRMRSSIELSHLSPRCRCCRRLRLRLLLLFNLLYPLLLDRWFLRRGFRTRLGCLFNLSPLALRRRVQRCSAVRDSPRNNMSDMNFAGLAGSIEARVITRREGCAPRCCAERSGGVGRRGCLGRSNRRREGRLWDLQSSRCPCRPWSWSNE